MRPGDIEGRICLGIVLLLNLFVIPGVSLAAVHCVRAGTTGKGSGSDWVNAFPQLPARLVRGDTYYLAAGRYPPYTFNTPDSGASFIIVKAATVADHGENLGWQNSYAGQAVFTSGSNSVFNIHTGHLVLDGNGRATLTSGHGIKIDGSGCTGSYCWDVALATGVTGITLRYLEILGTGDAAADVHVDENIRAVGNGAVPLSGGTNLTLQYLYVHESSDTPILMGQTSNVTLEYSVIAHNRSTPINHGEGLADQGSSNVTIRYNEFRDIEGTAFIDVLSRGGPPQTADNWNIYGNVFLYSNGNPSGRTGVGNGIVAVINGQEASNWNIHNNTSVNIPGLTARVSFAGSPGTNRSVHNNLWYNCPNAAHNGSLAADYNYYIKSAHNREPHEESSRRATSPFVDWVNYNFHLVLATHPGLSLAAPFNVDPDGSVRGADGNWDRGAYEFVAGSVAPAKSSSRPKPRIPTTRPGGL